MNTRKSRFSIVKDAGFAELVEETISSIAIIANAVYLSLCRANILAFRES
jgi:hypothetical protein